MNPRHFKGQEHVPTPDLGTLSRWHMCRWRRKFRSTVSCVPCPVCHIPYPVPHVLCPMSHVLRPVSHIPCPLFHVPSQVPGAEPFQGHSSVQEAVPLHSVTRLSLNATPSWYLNHIKAFFYYISPCDFAWLHSNYQPCCSTRGLHCLLLLPFYGKWLILHNPNQSTAVR